MAKAKPKRKMPLVREMLDRGYKFDRSETFVETYERLSELRLWKSYRDEQQGLLDSGVDEDVIEEILWNRYSPNALISRSLQAKESKDAGPSLEAVTQDDLHWVFQNIDQELGTYFTDAPSAGASSLYERARKDNKIYQWVLDHITPKTFIDTGGSTWDSDQARSLTGIARQLREATNDRRTELRVGEEAGV